MDEEDEPGCGWNMEGLVLECRGVCVSWSWGSRVPRRKIQEEEKQRRVEKKNEEGLSFHEVDGCEKQLQGSPIRPVDYLGRCVWVYIL